MRVAWQQQRNGAAGMSQGNNTRGAGRRRAAASVAAALALASASATAAFGDVTWGNFNDGTAPGFGALTNAGVVPWQPPVAGAVIPGAGGLAGSNVLQITGDAAFNFGQASGAALGFDFLSQNLRTTFFEHDQI